MRERAFAAGKGGAVSVRPVERRWEPGEFAGDPQREVLSPAPALWAARALDRELWALVHAEARAERELARGLAALWDGERYRPLGYVRAIDFVREHLGIEEGTARRLARLGRVLEATPVLDQAFVGGRLSASHVLELAAVVTAETSAEEGARWIAAATGLTFRALERRVRTARAERGEKEEVTEEAAAEGMDPAPDGGWMMIPAPARIGVLWQETVAVARATAGEHLRQGQAAELIFAEYLAATGGDRPDPEPDLLGAAIADAARQRLIADLMAAMNAQAHKKPRRERPTVPEEEAPPAARFPRVQWTVPADVLPPDCVIDPAADPWVLGETLVRIARYQSRLRTEIARRLARLHGALLWAQLGFADFTTYCEERLGFGLRQAERLVRFHHGLERFPEVRAAHRAGELSYTAALLLLPLLHETTEELWVNWAARLTYREIERVTEFARLFALPGADESVLASWADGLIAMGFAQRREDPGANSTKISHDPTAFDATAAAEGGRGGRGDRGGRRRTGSTTSHDPTAFDATAAAGDTTVPPDVPLGYPLPPTTPRGLPAIAGFPADLALLPQERCLATIRFFLPHDVLDLAHSALLRCRLSQADPLRPTWVYLELLLCHFLDTHSSAETRAHHQRAHPVLCRDGFLCTSPGCTGHAHLEDHHLHFRSRGGSDHPANRTTVCAGHHRPAIHQGTVELGGLAPDHLIARLGIHPATGRAFAAYIGERRVSDHTARTALADWRRSLRRRAPTMAADREKT